MGEGKKILYFSGDLTFGMIQTLVYELTQKISAYNFSVAVRKKILNIAVECLENIYKYTDKELYKNNPDLYSRFSVTIIDNSILLSSGNILTADHVEKVKTRIELINDSTRDELLTAYEDIINNGQISQKGGAGLGFIDMALKSGNCLECSFNEKENNTCYFEYTVKIDIK